jgi:hypothetical protein
MYTQAAIPMEAGHGLDTLELFWDSELGSWATNINATDRMTVEQVADVVRLGLLVL